MPPRSARAAAHPLHAAVTRLVADELGGILGGGSLDAMKGELRDLARRDPLDTAVATALTCTLLFYNAERGVNPKVKTPADALLFVTTCMSVGYADIFAKTTAGKLIASYAMTVGPSMTARILYPPAAEGRRADAEERDFRKALLAKLDALSAQLAARP